MLTLIIAIAAACGAFAAARWGADFGWVGSALLALLGFGVCQAAFGFFFKKRITRVMEEVQGILTAGQKQIQAKIQRWQVRPPGSLQQAQREIFSDTKVFVREALAATEGLRRFRPWVPMIERQIATAQLQLNWMIKEFAKVDELMPKALFIDPTTVAIKMARMYVRKEPSEAIGKVYRKAVRRLRYNQNVLLAATWSWILVQRGDVDGAFRALTEALKSSDNATLKANHQALMNNWVTHFSNSGLGDVWYSLFLEEPKAHAQRPRGGGFR